MALSLCGGGLAAQNTFLVDASGLQAAIDAAAPGDVLRVQSGSLGFSALRIDKPLAIHIDAGIVFFAVDTAISGIPAGTTLVLQGLDSRGGRLTVQDCAGPVVLAGCTLQISGGTVVRRCGDVAVEDSQLTGGLLVESSTLLLHGSTVRGLEPVPHLTVTTGPALDLRNSDVGICDCTLWGGTQTVSPLGDPSRPALELAASSARAAGTTSLVAGSGVWTQDVDAVSGNGSLVYDDRTTFVPLFNGAPIGAGVTGSALRLPTVAVTRSSIGSSATFTGRGEPNGVFGLLLGLPGPSFTLPGIDGAGRVRGFVVLLTAGFDGQGQFSFSYAVPNNPVLRASPFRWQAVATVGLRLVWSEPATEAHF
ncbi:MAG: hypothetical protein R3F56_06190 [Planctomycetota bacterium]